MWYVVVQCAGTLVVRCFVLLAKLIVKQFNTPMNIKICHLVTGVFGISSDEYLNYAMQNRRQWEEQGESVVAEMIERAETADADAAARRELEEGQETSLFEV